MRLFSELIFQKSETDFFLSSPPPKNLTNRKQGYLCCAPPLRGGVFMLQAWTVRGGIGNKLVCAFTLGITHLPIHKHTS